MPGELSGGLVDATLLAQLERAGYAASSRRRWRSRGAPLAPARRPAAAAAARAGERIEVDFAALTITRPPGVELDSGGLAKGLFADALAETLASHAGFAINCAGDLAIGGAGAVMRPIHVASPFDGSTLHTFKLAHTGVATSGIGRRSWIGDGRPPGASSARPRQRRAGVHRRRAGRRRSRRARCSPRSAQRRPC